VLVDHGQLRLGQPGGHLTEEAALGGPGVHGRKRSRLRPDRGPDDAEKDGVDVLGLVAHDRAELDHLLARWEIAAKLVAGDQPF